MGNASTLSISELRQLVGGLFDGLERAGVHHVPIDASRYWTVFPSDAFSAQPPAPVVGDVLDDLNDLKSDVDQISLGETVPFWHALNHLKGLLGFLAAVDVGDGLLAAQEGLR